MDDYEQWAARMSRTMLGDDLHPGTAYDWQDLQQEAMIAAWQAEQAFDPTRSPNREAFVKWKARNHAKTVLRAREKHAVHRGVDDSEDVLGQLLTEDPSVIDAVIEAYHAGEVHRALDTLTPKQREYVIARFWEGLTEAELTARFGYGPSGIWGAPTGRGGARRKLAAALEHLREGSYA